MDKFSTENFKIVKIKGYYRLKFTGNKLPTIKASFLRWGEGIHTREQNKLYKFMIRHAKICYISTRGKYYFCPQVYEDKEGKIHPIWKRFSKKEIRDGKKELSRVKRYMKSKEYKELKCDEFIENVWYEYLAQICQLGELHQCIKFIIDKCKKMRLHAIIIPLFIQFVKGPGHHNLILIKGKKAWRLEHEYGASPELNEYLEKQFKKIDIKFQGYLYHLGHQTVCRDNFLCSYWSMYFAFYYGLNKKVGFDDMFYAPGKNSNKEMIYQMQMFMAYITELLKKIKSPFENSRTQIIRKKRPKKKRRKKK